MNITREDANCDHCGYGPLTDDIREIAGAMVVTLRSPIMPDQQDSLLCCICALELGTFLCPLLNADDRHAAKAAETTRMIKERRDERSRRAAG